MKIAIVGSGISGLASAYFLHEAHEITIYEKNAYLGGHSRTIDVACSEGEVRVDTGFIVFNEHNYPLLTSLFKRLGVDVANSNMSFGISLDNGGFEYGTDAINSLFAFRHHGFSPRFWKMLLDLSRFFTRAVKTVERYPDLSTGQLLQKMRLGGWFADYFLVPIAASIWSIPAGKVLDYPAKTLVGFMDNHALLNFFNTHQWKTVRGGSAEYVKKLSAPFTHTARLNCGVQQIIRHDDSVEVLDMQGQSERYDYVVLACHSDEALALLANPSRQEQNLLRALPYQNNRIITHSDVRFMPRVRQFWSSWNYLGTNHANDSSANNPDGAATLTYWMNNLQPLNTKTPIFVTLNPNMEAEQVHDLHEFTHPIFNQAGIQAQTQLQGLQNLENSRTLFCGAWHGYGFHEDGLGSAVKIAEFFQIEHGL